MPFALTLALAVMTMVITPGWSHAAARAQTKPSAQSKPTPPSTAALEQAVFQQVNAYRARQSLPVLRWDERLAQQSRQHSQTMLNSGLGHAGFEQRLAATRLPWSAAAENVAYNYGELDPTTRAVQGWLSSPGHRRNLEGSFTLTGIGVARNARGEIAFTQIFLRPR
jgi:uncharacterized protein YkwD